MHAQEQTANTGIHQIANMERNAECLNANTNIHRNPRSQLPRDLNPEVHNPAVVVLLSRRKGIKEAIRKKEKLAAREDDPARDPRRRVHREERANHHRGARKEARQVDKAAVVHRHQAVVSSHQSLHQDHEVEDYTLSPNLRECHVRELPK